MFTFANSCRSLLMRRASDVSSQLLCYNSQFLNIRNTNKISAFTVYVSLKYNKILINFYYNTKRLKRLAVSPTRGV